MYNVVDPFRVSWYDSSQWLILTDNSVLTTSTALTMAGWRGLSSCSDNDFSRSTWRVINSCDSKTRWPVAWRYLTHSVMTEVLVNVFRIKQSNMIWIDCLIEHGFTSAPTQYRLYGRRFLQVWWPNQQCQSSEGGRLVIQTGLSLTRLTSPCYNNTTWSGSRQIC